MPELSSGQRATWPQFGIRSPQSGSVRFWDGRSHARTNRGAFPAAARNLTACKSVSYKRRHTVAQGLTDKRRHLRRASGSAGVHTTHGYCTSRRRSSKKKKIRRAIFAVAGLIVVALVTVGPRAAEARRAHRGARHDVARDRQARRDDPPGARAGHARARRHPLDHRGNRRHRRANRHAAERQGPRARHRHPRAARRERAAGARSTPSCSCAPPRPTSPA